MPETDSEPRPSLPATPLAIEHLAQEINLLRDELRGRDERILSVLMRIEGDYKLLLHEHQNLARRVLALEIRESGDPLVAKVRKRALKVVKRKR
jgi:hypothetical protein